MVFKSKIEKRKVDHLKVFLLVFVFIMSPLFGGDSAYLHLSLILVVSTILYFLKVDGRIPTELFLFGLYLLFLAIIFCSGAILALGRNYSNSFLLYLMQIQVYLLFGGVLCRIFSKHQIDISYFVLMVVLVASINSAVIILEAFFPTLHNIIEGFLGQRSEKLTYATNTEKYRGFATSSGASLSFFNGLAISMLVWLTVNGRVRMHVAIICLILLGLSMIWIGRTGFIIGIAGIIIVAISKLKHNFKKIFIIMLALYVLVKLIFIVGSRQFDTFYFNYAFGFILEGYIGFLEDNSVSDLINNHYKFPENFWMILFGNGNYVGNFGTTNSDPGIIRSISAIGLPASISFYVYVVYLLIKYLNVDKTFTMLLLTVFFIGELKEPLLLKGYGARTLWFLIGYMILEKTKNRKYNSAIPTSF